MIADVPIVTCDSREFLYDRMFSKVLTWTQYCTQFAHEGILKSGVVIDLPALVMRTQSVEAITQIKSSLSEKDIAAFRLITPPERGRLYEPYDYACMVIRKRNHCPDRDLPEEYLQKLIREALRRYPRLYVMGKDIENYCEIDPERMMHVSLHEFAWLIGREDCKRVVGPLSGGMGANCIYGKAPATFLDAAKERHNYFGDHPLMFGECVNLAGIRMNHMLVSEDWEKVFNG